MAAPLAAPKRLPFQSTARSRQTRPSRHALPSSSGVTAKGATLQAGLAWTQPKPVFISMGARVRSDQSLIWTISWMWPIAASGDMPIGTASTITPNSPSKSMPKRFVGHQHIVARAIEFVRQALIHQRAIARDRIEPEGDLHKLAMRFKRRAIEPLPRARQRGAEMLARQRIALACRQRPASCRERSGPVLQCKLQQSARQTGR